MLLDIFLSILIFPNFWQQNFNLASYLELTPQTIVATVPGPQRIYTDLLDIKTTATSALAVDAQSGKILYEKNSNQVLPIASITKLMTALVFLEHNPGWQTEIHTIAADRRNGGIIYLNTDENLTIRNLFNTALIVSDNDSAMALSRASGLSEQEFIKQMNVKAGQLGLTNTQFVDPTGLKLGNKSTVKDLAKLVNIALQNENIKRTTSTAYYEFEVQGKEKSRTVKLRNTDWLLNGYLDVIGGKTGSLEEAGYCLAVKIRGSNNQEIIAVVLGSQSNLDRFQDVKALTDWSFTNFQW